MKRKTLLAVAVLLTALACLFTSCSASVEPPKAEEEFGYVTFGNGGSRSLSTEYGIKSYDSLYWYYTATKKDNFGFTGQATEQTKVPAKNEDGTGIGSGTIRLSQGAWEFELFAYESVRTGTASDNLVYQGKSDTIVLKGGETKAVPVSVNLKGEKGLVNLSGAWFEWANESDAEGKISVTVELAKDGSIPIKYFFGPLTRSSGKYTFASNDDTKQVNEGYYTCTVNAYMEGDVDVTHGTVKADATPLATQTLGLRVYGNATTYITDNLTEGIFAKVVFDVAEQDMKVFVPNTDGSASITGISVTPSGDTTKTTSVEFSENALSGLADDATLQLDVKVTPVEAAFEKFQVSGTTADNKSAFAGIDITLKQTTANGQPVAVDSFNSNPDTTATVTTYIATGLSGVSVHYSSDNGTTENFIIGTEAEFVNGSAKGYYESETGKLVFTTTHFSEYYVLANCVAFNSSRNVAYATLEKAIDYAQTGDIVKLMADYTIPASNNVEIAEGKNFTLDLNGKTITEEGAGARKIINRGELTIIDSFGTGKIQNKYVGESGNDGSYGLIDNYGTLTIKSGNFTDVAHGNGSSFRNRPGATLIINGGTFVNTADDSGKQASGFTGAANAFVYSDGTDVRINGGTFTMEYARYTPAIKIMAGTGSIEGTTISTYMSGGVEVGSDVEIRNTNIRVSNENSYYANAIAVSNDGKVDVYSGTFTGYKYGAYIYSSGGIINIYGGTINAETALRADNDVYVPKNSEINVYGGSFRGGYTVGTEAKLAITGGTFSVDPSNYVVSLHTAVNNGNETWTVQRVPEVKIGDTYYAGLPEAISAAQSGDTIELGEGVFYSTGANTRPNTSGNKTSRNITIVGSGSDKTVIRVGSADFIEGEHGGDYAFDGEGTITFKNLTLKDNYNDNASYRGYIRPGKMILEYCNVLSLFHYWGSGDVEFTNCNFITPDYCITLYSGTSFTFKNCTFTSAGNSNDTAKKDIGKFINAYREADGGDNPISVHIEECQFITTCTNSYQAICLKGYKNNAWDVLIKNSSITVNGTNYGSFDTSDSVKYSAVRNSSLYDLKDPNNKTIVRIIDTKLAADKVVWKNGAMVSND